MDVSDDDEGRRDLMRRARRVAVVGASPSPSRASHSVLRWLTEHTDYELYPVNPAATEILGLQVYPSLAALPVLPDLVDVFRRVPELSGVTDEAVACGAQALWFQLGLRDDASARRALDAGMTVVQDRCLKVEYAALLG